MRQEVQQGKTGHGPSLAPVKSSRQVPFLLCFVEHWTVICSWLLQVQATRAVCFNIQDACQTVLLLRQEFSAGLLLGIYQVVRNLVLSTNMHSHDTL